MVSIPVNVNPELLLFSIVLKIKKGDPKTALVKLKRVNRHHLPDRFAKRSLALIH